MDREVKTEVEVPATNLDSAIRFYKSILFGTYSYSGEHYNVRHGAAMRIGELFLKQQRFEAATYYLKLAKITYPPRFSCGNAYHDFNRDITVLFAQCYIGQGDYKKAIDSLTPFMFVRSFSDNRTLSLTLYNAYTKVYTKAEIRKEFLRAEKSLAIETEKWNENIFFHCYITVFGNKIEISPYTFLPKPTEAEQKQSCLKNYRESEIFKLATTD